MALTVGTHRLGFPEGLLAACPSLGHVILQPTMPGPAPVAAGGRDIILAFR